MSTISSLVFLLYISLNLFVTNIGLMLFFYFVVDAFLDARVVIN
jgi:hypothetical protein